MPAGKERVAEIIDFSMLHGDDSACEVYEIDKTTLDRYRRVYKHNEKAKVINDDKKHGEFNWREWTNMMIRHQDLHEKASWSQDQATIEIKTEYPCIVYKPMADQHLGSIGTNYETFTKITDLFLTIPYLYGSLLGDENDNFVSFKNQLAVLQQIISPEEQDEFVESWLLEITPKLLFSTFGNHSAFEERVSGKNALKKILNRNMIYFNGIGICNLKINNQTYKIVVTHKTPQHSTVNLTHGLKQLARKEIPDADIYLEGHYHIPAVEVAFERGLFQVFMVLGTLKQNDGYAKRGFSYFTADKDGAIVFDSTQHRVIPFPCLDDALEFARLKNGA